MRCAAVELLAEAQARTGSLVSVGLEPCAEYLPAGWPATIESHERFLKLIIEATSGIACAYKANLAFFEALGPEGWALLHKSRTWVPDSAVYIADGKRGDIGSSAARYAEALYTGIGFDAATANPLMGHDALEPFLVHEDRLTLALALTSNPGAADFLEPDSLWERIIEHTMKWSATERNAGFVVGATRPDRMARARELAHNRVILVPGVGAQGGAVESVIRDAALDGPFSGVIIHVTRGVLPGASDAGRDPGEVIRAKTIEWNERIAGARAASGRTA